jgi:hypothetical protein
MSMPQEAIKAQPRYIDIPECRIALDPGEHYAGLVLGKTGMPSHHLVLLSGEVESITWAKAKEWAKGAGGDLPSRQEQALLYANLKEQFKSEWYWSGEEHASASGYAWYQYFTDGYQYDYPETTKLRARAVRRLVIQ